MHKGRTTVKDLVAVVIVLLLIALALAPALARLQRSSGEAQCQSNLHKWAQALSLYCQDNGGRYPTNRTISGATAGNITAFVNLTPDGQLGPDGNQKRQGLSINWVEAVYPYLWAQAKRTGEDWRSLRACPKAQATGYNVPSGAAATAYMTYSFSYYLIEQPAALARQTNKLMMMREMDCHVNSILRPSIPTSSTSPPAAPFLNKSSDSTITILVPTTGKIHDQGSYIAFADGHVRYFGVEYYPNNTTEGIELDATEQRYYNYVTKGTAATQKTIAITP